MEFQSAMLGMPFDSTNKQHPQPHQSNNIRIKVLPLRGIELFQEYVYFSTLQDHIILAFEGK